MLQTVLVPLSNSEHSVKVKRKRKKKKGINKKRRARNKKEKKNRVKGKRDLRLKTTQVMKGKMRGGKKMDSDTMRGLFSF